jgi:hypothetical protein
MGVIVPSINASEILEVRSSQAGTNKLLKQNQKKKKKTLEK